MVSHDQDLILLPDSEIDVGTDDDRVAPHGAAWRKLFRFVFAAVIVLALGLVTLTMRGRELGPKESGNFSSSSLDFELAAGQRGDYIEKYQQQERIPYNKMKAGQSSTQYRGQPWKVLTKYPLKNWWGRIRGGTCTHTRTQKNPWWRVALNGEYYISAVRLASRSDCCASRLQNFDVFVGGEKCNSEAQTVPQGKWKEVKCGKSGESITIRLNTPRNVLTLCGFQAFGSPSTTRPSPTPPTPPPKETKETTAGPTAGPIELPPPPPKETTAGPEETKTTTTTATTTTTQSTTYSFRGGEAVCEGHDFDEEQCADIGNGCCHFCSGCSSQGECMSSVGPTPCPAPPPPR